MTTTQQQQPITSETIYRGARIQTQRNGYLTVILGGHRHGGFVSLEEAQAFILNNR